MTHFGVGLPFLLSMLTFALIGCGMTGTTTHSQVSPDSVPKAVQVRPTVLASITREEEGVRLMSVGVFAWGRFDENDQSNIAASISDALATAARGADAVVGEPIEVHVLIRKYFVGASNNAGAVFSGVDWVAATLSKEVLYHDSFYATSYCKFPRICTLGSEKDVVNHAIVERIVTRAFVFASGQSPGSVATNRTYATFAEAAATMPEVLKSWGTAFLVGSIPVIVPGTAPRDLSLEWAEMGTPVDWSRKLRDSPR
jgi:hypothetical protein